MREFKIGYCFANGLVTSFVWGIFNFAFLIETFILSVISATIQDENELLFKIIASVIVIAELTGCFIGFYFFGKKSLVDFGSHGINIFSLLSIHIIILVILIGLNGLVGHGFGRGLVGWYQEIIFAIFGYFSFLSDILFDIFCNPIAIIVNTLIPYIVMYIGNCHADPEPEDIENEDEISE